MATKKRIFDERGEWSTEGSDLSRLSARIAKAFESSVPLFKKYDMADLLLWLHEQSSACIFEVEEQALIDMDEESPHAAE